MKRAVCLFLCMVLFIGAIAINASAAGFQVTYYNEEIYAGEHAYQCADCKGYDTAKPHNPGPAATDTPPRPAQIAAMSWSQPRTTSTI